MRVRYTVIYKTNLKRKNNLVNAKNATQNATTTKGQCARSWNVNTFHLHSLSKDFSLKRKIIYSQNYSI